MNILYSAQGAVRRLCCNRLEHRLFQLPASEHPITLWKLFSIVTILTVVVGYFCESNLLQAQPCQITSIPDPIVCQPGSQIAVNVSVIDKDQPPGCYQLWCDPSRQWCNNCCELCCPYRFEIINNTQSFGRNIIRVGLCTNLGCDVNARTFGEVWNCNAIADTQPPTADHVCSFCGTERVSTDGASQLNVWVEDPICGGPVYTALLCKTNCIRFIPTAQTYMLTPGDKLRIVVGFTGTCIDRLRPIGRRRKCVMICAQFDDGTESCCMAYLPHCQCTGLDAPPCDHCKTVDPDACSEDYKATFPPANCIP